MARFKKMQQEKTEGRIIYGSNIVDNIVCLTVSELPFVELYHKVSGKKKNSAITVFVDKKGIDVDICVKIHFTQRVSEIVFKIQEAVRHNVESMTEYKIHSVNVIVMGVLFTDIRRIKAEQTENNNENNAENSAETTLAIENTEDKKEQ